MSRSLSRRDFLGLGAGAASLAVVSGLGLLRPTRADAVIGIDDAALGGLVLLVATLGGYTLSRTVANVSLDSLGYGFSDFVSDASNQTAAVTQAIADANNLGVELNRANAESAAQSIAAGTGYFAEVMSDAATSGRVALDNFISGAGELPGVLRSLVGNFVTQKLGVKSNLLPGCVTNSDLVNINGASLSFDNVNANIAASTNDDILSNISELQVAPSWSISVEFYYFKNYRPQKNYIKIYGNVPINMSVSNNVLIVTAYNSSDRFYKYQYNIQYNGTVSTPTASTEYSVGLQLSTNDILSNLVVSGDLVSGGTLPAVDRATDAPDVIGPGYDSLPLANDLVIDPSTDEVVSAGSLPLPTSIPDVFGDFVGTLNDILAGVIPGQISLPVSVSEPVVVGTAEGVQSMSITDAVAGDTSLSTAIDPPIDPYPPYDPIEPPVDVPEGPWTPAVSLPFERIWPFNMIYDFVELFEQLGGS